MSPETRRGPAPAGRPSNANPQQEAPVSAKRTRPIKERPTTAWLARLRWRGPWWNEATATDEFDSIAKERADTNETGEIKRVVSTLLLQIDRLPAHVVVVCSTNHSELLDRAAWRRFQLRLELDAPTRVEATAFLEEMRTRLGGDLGLAPRTLADKLSGASYAELEQVAVDIRRRYVLALPDGDLARIARTRIEQWRTQAASSRPSGAG